MRKIETYERFHRHLAAWVDREIESLMVSGRGGVGKSRAYQTALGNRPYHRLGGRQTPLQVYNTLHDAPDRPIVLDDISALLKDDNFRDLLKSICETGERVVHWGSTTSRLEGRSHSFICTSPVLIVLNRIPGRDADVAAILDRFDAVEFAPTKNEIIARMRCIFPEEQNLINLIADLPALPSLRTLVKARQWKRSRHLSLTEELLAECGVPEPVSHLAQIIESFPDSEWCQEYVKRTGLTDRTYRRHKPLARQLVEARKSAK